MSDRYRVDPADGLTDSQRDRIENGNPECPECGGETEHSGCYYWCVDPDCDGRASDEPDDGADYYYEQENDV